MAANMDKFELAKFSFHQAGMDEGLNLELNIAKGTMDPRVEFILPK